MYKCKFRYQIKTEEFYYDKQETAIFFCKRRRLVKEVSVFMQNLQESDPAVFNVRIAKIKKLK